MSNSLKILVFGATGQQGGAVARALMADGQSVIGLTRNPDSDKAKALASSGAEVKKGDFHKAEDLVPLMKEVDTVFALTTPFEEGVDKETAQGIAIAEAAKEAGVGHFVFNSVSDADKNTGIPHFDSKYRVERKIVELGLNYTIIAPVYFMTNLVSPWTMDTIKTGKISMAMPSDRVLQQIDVPDIAAIAAAAIRGREKYFGKRYNIAGDELTGDQMASVLKRVTGKDFTYEGFDPAYMREQSADMAAMFEWFIKIGYSVDVEELKRDFPRVTLSSFEDYARRVDWSFMD